MSYPASTGTSNSTPSDQNQNSPRPRYTTPSLYNSKERVELTTVSFKEKFMIAFMSIRLAYDVCESELSNHLWEWVPKDLE